MDTTAPITTSITNTAATAAAAEAHLLLEEQQDWFFGLQNPSKAVCKRVALAMGIESGFVYEVALKAAVAGNFPSIAPSSPSGYLDAYERLLRVAVDDGLVAQKAEAVAWRKDYEAEQRAERKAKFASGPAPSTRALLPSRLAKRARV